MAIASERPKNSIVAAGIIILLLLLGLTPLIVPAIFNSSGLHTVSATQVFISRLVYWACLAFAGWYCLKIEKQQLLIWNEKKYSFSKYLLAVVAMFLIIVVGSFILLQISALTHLNKKSLRMEEIVAIFRVNTPLLVFTCLTAGIVEELIFRGYILPRLEIIFKNPTLAIIISSAFFGLLHYGYGTVFNMVVPFFIGLVFAVYYSKYRNITVIIIFHFLWDLLSLLISIKYHLQ